MSSSPILGNLSRRRVAISLPLTVVCLAALALMVMPTAAFSLPGAGAPSSGPASSPGIASAEAPSSAPSSQLQLAVASLQHGAGPTGGAPARCSSSTESTSVACAFGPADKAPARPSSVTSPAWQELNTPSGRYGATLTYDAADHYVLLFGEGDSSYATSDTWAFANGIWTDVTPAISPPARVSPFMAYDAHDGYVVLFGGWGGNNGGPSEYGDTWRYLGGVWTQLFPVSSPNPRDSGAMTYDAADGYLILFGDYASDNDTWTFFGGQWVHQIPSSICTTDNTNPCPPGRQDEGLVYDAKDHYVLMFGGEAYPNYVNDTWTYVGGKWTNITATACKPNGCPSAREEASMTYDSRDGYVLLFGGYNGTDLGDTWKFVGGTWTEISAGCNSDACPYDRSGAGIAFDTIDNAVVLFGGYDEYADTWTYVAGTWAPWTPGPAPGSPGPRTGAAMAYDAADQKVILFGGWNGAPLGDTWSFSNGAWTAVDLAGSCTDATCPPARYDANMTYDAADGYLVLFGGVGSGGTDLRDTWKFVGGTWTEILAASSCTGATCPSARGGFSLTYDVSDGYVVLFGGSAGGTLEQDTWKFSGGDWTELITGGSCTSATCPSARAGAAMTFDAADGYVLLFGGVTTTGPTNDTWTFVGGAWSEKISPTQKCSSGCPSPRAGAAMSYDPNFGYVYLFGGTGASGPMNDTWRYYGGHWSQIYAYYPPYNRAGANLVWDGAEGATILFGGSGAALLGDTWEFDSEFKDLVPVITPSSPDVGQTVSFAASATGGSLTGSYSFLWQGLPAGCDPAQPVASFSCAPTLNGTYYVTTIAMDSDGSPAAETSSIIPVYVSLDPIVTLVANGSTIDLGQTSNLTATMSLGTGTGVYEWSGLPPACVPAAQPTGAVLACTPTGPSNLGTWTVGVQAIDSDGVTSAPSFVTLTVLNGPWASTPTSTQTSVDVGQTLRVTSSGHGGTGSYTYFWTGLPTGCAVNAPAVACLVPAATAGPYTPTVQIEDSNGDYSAAVSAAASIMIYADPTISAPSFALTALPPTPTSSVTAGTNVTISATATLGSGGDTVVWSGLPTGCASLARGSLSFSCTPTVAGTYPISASITDMDGWIAVGPTSTLSVVAAASPPPLVVSAGASPEALDVGASTLISANAAGGTGGYAFSWSGLPSGCSGSGEATFTCAPRVANSTYVGVVVTDSAGVSASTAFFLQVFPGLQITALAASPSTVTLGNSTTFLAQVVGGDGDLSYYWSGLPAGCAAADAPAITCTPSTTGSSTVQLKVTDATGASAVSPSLSLTVNAVPTGSTSFAQGATGLTWTMFALIVLVLVLALLSLVMSLRSRGPRPPARKSPEEWDEGAERPPKSEPSASKTTTPSPASTTAVGSESAKAPAPGSSLPSGPRPSFYDIRPRGDAGNGSGGSSSSDAGTSGKP